MKPKPGYKTTEFWLTMAINVASLCSALASVLPPKWAAILSAVSTVGYSVSRGLTKSGSSK